MKFDNGKPPLNLVPSSAIIACAEVFAFGAQKYGANNWRKDMNKFPVSRHFASIQRHLLAWNDGEDIDPESGLPHLHHAMTQLMILTVCLAEATAPVDDRFKKDMIDEN